MMMLVSIKPHPLLRRLCMLLIQSKPLSSVTAMTDSLNKWAVHLLCKQRNRPIKVGFVGVLAPRKGVESKAILVY